MSDTEISSEKSEILTALRNKTKLHFYWGSLAIYLVIVIVIQFIFIERLQSEINILKHSVETQTVECDKVEIQYHTISKRNINSYTCPPGCYKRRRRTTTTTERPYVYDDYYSQYYGNSGPQGPAGARGSPGLPGGAGAPGLPGGAGAPGLPGGHGMPGRPGPPGGSGSRGAPGAPGESGSRGTPGAPGGSGRIGASGLPGLPGSPGQSYDYNNYYNYGQRPQVRRGDQGIPPEDYTLRNETKMDEAMREFRRLDHPKCKDEVDHKALMDTLKDKGKVSFMILVDLQDNIYCIVHSEV